MNKTQRFIFALSAFLSLSTYLILELPWRYDLVRYDILGDRAWQEGIADWDRSAGVVAGAPTNGPLVACLEPGEGATLPFLSKPVAAPSDISHLRVSAGLKADRLVPGMETWQRGHVQLWSFDADGRPLWYWPHEIAVIEDAGGWQDHALVVPVAGSGRAVRFLAYNGALEGALCLRDVRIEGLTERRLFAALRYALWPLWAASLLWISVLVMRTRRPILLKGGLLGAGLVILALVLMPQPYYATVSHPLEFQLGLLASLFESAQPPSQSQAAGSDVAQPQEKAATHKKGAQIWESYGQAQPRPPPVGLGPFQAFFTFKNLAHAAAFFALAVLIGLTYGQLGLPLCIAAALLCVIASESMQFLVITRSSQWSDLLAGACGATLGVLLGALVRLRFRLRGRQPQPRPPAP